MYPNMRGPKKKGLLLFFAALLLPLTSALAQEADTSNVTLQEVVVTGSRIPAPNEVSTSPIQVLSSTYIEKTGLTDIGDIINQLPQNFTNSLGQDLGNGSSAA